MADSPAIVAVDFRSPRCGTSPELLALVCPKCGAPYHEFLGELFGGSQAVYRCQACQQLFLNGHPAGAVPVLSAEEQRLLMLIASDKINKQIARDLGISLRTVHLRRRGLMTKIGATNKFELVMKAVELGILPRPASGA